MAAASQVAQLPRRIIKVPRQQHSYTGTLLYFTCNLPVVILLVATGDAAVADRAR